MRLDRTSALIALAVVACSYRDVGEPEVKRTFTVASASVSPFTLVLTPTDCPTESVRVEGDIKASSHRHEADVACMGALKVGSTITVAKQRIKQGCMPGKVYRDVLGGCELGPMTLTSTGTKCTKPAPAP